MRIIYFYDLKVEERGGYGALKRRFYYHFNKLGFDGIQRINKSVISVDPSLEGVMDNFFLKFSGNVEVFKVYAKFIEKL